jgi:GH15 family glucan-1,4-alpha-glucosidase
LIAESAPTRIDGYAPIRGYAAIGDGRTVALVASDGSIDWLPYPSTDAPSVFGSILDARSGGSFRLAPAHPYAVTRRYLPGTNVLETTFTTASGSAVVTDAITTPSDDLGPELELIRSIRGVSGVVPFRWSVEPRFGFGGKRITLGRRYGVPVVEAGSDAVAVASFDAGDAETSNGAIAGRFDATEGSSSAIALSFAHQEPLVLPDRRHVEERVGATIDAWVGWSGCNTYQGPWKEAVERSGLALKLLFFAPSGAVAAAATTSLPEAIGGVRNWDYRLSWIRDSAFTLHALLRIGCAREADAFFWWLMHASQLTHPRLGVLYRLDGGAEAPERVLDLDGYRGSKPVRVGNAAAEQLQLEIYGSLLQAAAEYAAAGHYIDAEIRRRLAEIADLVCDIWRRPDSGIWEVRSDPQHFTQSKMMCWVALDRAIGLAGDGARAERWRREAAAIREYIGSECWSDELGSYRRAAGLDELDASILIGFLAGYPNDDGRSTATVAAIRAGLTDGPFVRRYIGEDGLLGSEGAFLACSFWLVEALVRTGQRDDAWELMRELLGSANDVGLFAEEIDPRTGEFLGNFPQALTHLALIGAAIAFEDVA